MANENLFVKYKLHRHRAPVGLKMGTDLGVRPENG